MIKKIISIFILFLIIAGCQDETPVEPETPEAEAMGKFFDNRFKLTEILGAAYDHDNSDYVVVGVGFNSKIDVFYGYHLAWTRLPANDMDNRFIPEEFVDIAIGRKTGKFGETKGIVIGTEYGMGVVINIRDDNGMLFFGDEGPKQINDLTATLAAAYDPVNDNYYVAGINPQGELDVYYGCVNNWQKLDESYDLSEVFSPSEFKGFAFGGPSHRIAVGTKNGKAVSVKVNMNGGIADFSGETEKISRLKETLDIAYDATNDKYYVVGIGKRNKIDIYHGHHDDWNKLGEIRDIDKVFSKSTYKDIVFGEPTGPFDRGVALAVGNSSHYDLGLSLRGTRIGREPWFGIPLPVMQ